MSNKKTRRRRQREQRWFKIFNQTMTLTDEDILMSIAAADSDPEALAPRKTQLEPALKLRTKKDGTRDVVETISQDDGPPVHRVHTVENAALIRHQTKEAQDNLTTSMMGKSWMSMYQGGRGGGKTAAMVKGELGVIDGAKFYASTNRRYK